MATATDPHPSEWAIDDEVVRLREWGTGIIHQLPEPPVGELELGASEGCAIRLRDASGQVSHRHARLERRSLGWVAQDLGSKNGLRFDGARRPRALLQPGSELGIGSLTLLAESRQSLELRGYLRRLLGWDTARTAAVDLALRALRLSASGRAPLALFGSGDLVPIALALHRRALGASRPFIVCDPRRRDSDASIRSARNVQSAIAALRAAEGGTLCVRSRRLPGDVSELLAALCEQRIRLQLVVCTQDPAGHSAFEAASITIPPLEAREHELPKLVEQYVEEAILSLAPGVRLTAADRDWLASAAFLSLPELEKAARRLVAIRSTGGNVSAAAKLLGMSHVGLGWWLARRGRLGA